MTSVNEIVAAARRLPAAEFARLRKKLDRIERSIWEKELKRATNEMRRAKITDRKIDTLVIRRRREGRT